MPRKRRPEDSSTSSSSSSSAAADRIEAQGSAGAETITSLSIISDTNLSEASRAQMRLIATKMDKETWFQDHQTVKEWRMAFENIPARKWRMIKHSTSRGWYLPMIVDSLYEFLQTFDADAGSVMSPFEAMQQVPRPVAPVAAPSLTVTTARTKVLTRAADAAFDVAETLLRLGTETTAELDNHISYQERVNTQMETDVPGPVALSTMTFTVPAIHNGLQLKLNYKIRTAHANVKQASLVGDSEAVIQHLGKLEIFQKTSRLALRAELLVSKFYLMICDRYPVLQIHPERFRRLPPAIIYRLLTSFATSLASKYNNGGEATKTLVFEEKIGTLANTTRAILFIHEAHGFVPFFCEWEKFAKGDMYSSSVVRNLNDFQVWWIASKRLPNPRHTGSNNNNKHRGSRGQSNGSRGQNNGKRKSSSSSSSKAAPKAKAKKPRADADGSGTPTSTNWVDGNN